MIESFSGEHRFLSNFWPSPIKVRGMMFPTVEHAYQAIKTTDEAIRKEISELPTPGKAKRFGKTLTLRSDWEIIKLKVMEALVTAKFKNKKLRAQLLSTGDEIIQEGNLWGDTFWGVCRGKGENHLGQILMKVRAELRSNQKD